MGEDVPFLRELVRLFRGESKPTELWNSARRPSKTVTKIKKAARQALEGHICDLGSQVILLATQDIPAKTR